MFWAIGPGVAAVFLACGAVGLLIYLISAFILGLAVRLMGFWLLKSRRL
jgi:preprotein translocase subunit Sss1